VLDDDALSVIPIRISAQGYYITVFEAVALVCTRESQFWGGNCLAGNECQWWLKLFAGSWRDAEQTKGVTAVASGQLWWRGEKLLAWHDAGE